MWVSYNWVGHHLRWYEPPQMNMSFSARALSACCLLYNMQLWLVRSAPTHMWLSRGRSQVG
jgi:hypothetical protein